jgi:hypothetical protein
VRREPGLTGFDKLVANRWTRLALSIWTSGGELHLPPVFACGG